MATSVDAKLLRSTKFPPEFNQKVDMTKVNAEVMKKWIASKISEILGNEDDVVIELCFNLIEGARFPDIKKMQIQLTGFLDKDTAGFCKELWKLCLSAQSNAQGVPKELLEAKKLELIQEKIESEKAAEQARKRRDDELTRERDVNAIRNRERGERGHLGAGHGRGGDSWRGRGGHVDDRRDFDRGRGGRDFDRRGPRYSRSPRRRGDSRERPYRGPHMREADTYVVRGRGEPRRDPRDERRRPSKSRSPSMKRETSESRSRSPPRRRYRSSSRSRSPPPRRRRSPNRSRSPDRRNNYRGRGGRGRGRSPDRGNRRRRYPSDDSSRSRSARPNKRRRATSESVSRSPSPRRRRRNTSSVDSARSRSKSRSVSRTNPKSKLKPRPTSVSRSPSSSQSVSHSRERMIATPDDDTEARARKSVDRDERRLTRSYSRSNTSPRRRRRSTTRSPSPDERDRKRRRSSTPRRKRRNSSSDVSPPATKARRADTEEASDRESPSLRYISESKRGDVAVTDEKQKHQQPKDPSKRASELKEMLLREKIKMMRTSSI